MIKIVFVGSRLCVTLPCVGGGGRGGRGGGRGRREKGRGGGVDGGDAGTHRCLEGLGGGAPVWVTDR